MDIGQAAFTALLAALASGLVSWLIQRRVLVEVETRKRLAEARARAYEDFVTRLVDYMFAVHDGADDREAVGRLVAEARARVVLFGSRSVLAKLSDPSLMTEDKLGGLLDAMRSDFAFNGEDSVSPDLVVRSLKR